MEAGVKARLVELQKQVCSASKNSTGCAVAFFFFFLFPKKKIDFPLSSLFTPWGRERRAFGFPVNGSFLISSMNLRIYSAGCSFLML